MYRHGRRVIAKKELRILFFNDANRVFNDLFKDIDIDITQAFNIKTPLSQFIFS